MRRRSGAMQLGGVCVLVMLGVAGWSLLRSTSVLSRVSSTPASRTAVETPANPLAVQTGRLRGWSESAPAPRASRNPFQFAAHEPTPSTESDAARPPALVVPADPRRSAEPGMPFALSGIAEQDGPEGPVRTAILSAPRALYHVEVGGVMLRRYRVTEITATRVTVLDLESGRAFELVLKAR